MKKRNALVSRILYPSYVQDIFNGRDCVAVFPEIGVVYNRIKKSGSTSVIGLLADLQHRRFEDERTAKKALLSPPIMSVGALAKIRNYYSFVIVRDPFARALSAFLDKVASGNPKFADIPGSGDASPQGFHDFLSFLERDGLHRDRHWWPQVDLLYKDVTAYSFIGKLETLGADMEKVLQDIGCATGELSNVRSPHRLTAHTTDATQKLPFFFDNAAREKVKRLYRRDFEAFGYEA